MDYVWNNGLPDFGTGALILTSDYMPDAIGGEGLSNEFWSPIDAEHQYWISTYGRVWSFITNRFLKQFKTTRYPSVVIHYLDGRKKTSYIHRLLAESFIPNREHLPCVRHLNDDPDNYDLDNLAWGTQEDNVRDMFANGGDSHKEVYCLDNGYIYHSCADAADDLKVSRSAITLCCQGKIKSVAGKRLRYLKEMED